MKLFSTGQIAKVLGVTRDDIEAFLRQGAPWSGTTAGRQRVYTEDDVDSLYLWCLENKKKVEKPAFLAVTE